MALHKRVILIHACKGDLHALIVHAALRERGHRALRVSGQELPSHSSLDLCFDNNSHPRLRLNSPSGTVWLHEPDVVWNFRPQLPTAPGNVVAADEEFVQRELAFAWRSLGNLLDSAFWVNPTPAARAANLKPVQLHHATRIGLSIPKTLISNDPETIRNFIRENSRVIYKPLSGHVWKEQDREFATYTSIVECGQLPPDTLLRTTPGIFQPLIAKQFEVRAQFFGDTCFAARIESQLLDYGELDWRLNQGHGVAASAITLPHSIHQKCRSLMKALGIVSGAFDFIVTPDDDWIFLEVNEAGLFLFLEQWLPELPLLDACCAFFESRDADFRYRKPRVTQCLKEISSKYPWESLLASDTKSRETNPHEPTRAHSTSKRRPISVFARSTPAQNLAACTEPQHQP